MVGSAKFNLYKYDDNSSRGFVLGIDPEYAGNYTTCTMIIL